MRRVRVTCKVPPRPAPKLRSYCPACDGFLQGGDHFEGRVCGSCHGETVGRVPTSPYPLVSGIIPSFPDCDIFLVDDDGTERPIPGVTSIEWRCKQGTEPALVVLHVLGVELDAEGLLALAERCTCLSAPGALCPRCHEDGR